MPSFAPKTKTIPCQRKTAEFLQKARANGGENECAHSETLPAIIANSLASHSRSPKVIMNSLGRSLAHSITRTDSAHSFSCVIPFHSPSLALPVPRHPTHSRRTRDAYPFRAKGNELIMFSFAFISLFACSLHFIFISTAFLLGFSD